MKIELAYRDWPSFIAWYKALTVIDQILVPAGPVLLLIYCISWLTSESASRPDHRKNHFIPILLMVSFVFGIAYVLSIPDEVPKHEGKKFTLELPTVNTPQMQSRPGVDQRPIQLNPDQSPPDYCQTHYCSGPGVGHLHDLTLYRQPDGHFYVNANLNGQSVRFLVDTGATNTTVPMYLAGSMRVPGGQQYITQTANGMTSGFIASGLTLRLENTDPQSIDVVFLPSTSTLLGMNALRQYDIHQERDVLRLVRHP